MKYRDRINLKSNDRLFYIDIVRFFSILFIVAGHIWPSTGLTVAVFIFMILSGYLWQDGRTVKDDIKRKSRALWGPYISWGIPLLVIVVIYELTVMNTPERKIIALIAHTLWGGLHATQPFTSFWYFSAIWFSIIIYRFIRNSSQVIYYLFIASALLTSAFFGEVLAHLPLGIGVSFICIVFFSIGRQWRKLPKKYSENIFIMVPSFAILSVIALKGFAAPMVLKSGDFGSPFLSIIVYSLIALSLVSISKIISDEVFGWSYKFVNLIVSFATPIILLHPVLIWVWEESSLDSISPVGRIPLFIAGVLIPLFVAYVLKFYCKRKYSIYLVP